MKSHRSIRFLILSLGLLASATATAQTIVSSPQDIVKFVEQKNYDIKLIQENTVRAEAYLNQLKGGYYYPTVRSKATYLDDHREPLSPFLPAYVQEGVWDASVESKTPVGVTVSAGKKLLGTRFGQADPPNDLLPYPATYFQPEVFLQASIDLTQNLLGYISKKEISIAEKDIQSTQYQTNLLRHRLTLAALELYYQLPLLDQIQTYSNLVTSDFKKLEKSLTGKVSKSLAEESDLFSIQSLIAEQATVISTSEKTIHDVKKSIAILLGDDQMIIKSQVSDTYLSSNVKSCEATVLNTPFKTDLSEEYALRQVEIDKADLQAKIIHRQLLPSVNLTGTAITTGTDSTYGSSLKELAKWERPAYQAVIDMSWQGSPGIYKSNRQKIEVVKNTAALEQGKHLLEQKNLWGKLQSNIDILRKKQTEITQAVNFGQKQITDLEDQYYKGRLSLFELTQERIRLFRASIEMTRSKQERLTNLLQSLQEFNQFDCSLIPES